MKEVIHIELFDDDCMLEVFGTLEPPTPERTARFFNLYEWRPNRIKLKPNCPIQLRNNLMN